jgi:hypothetical protein
MEEILLSVVQKIALECQKHMNEMALECQKQIQEIALESEKQIQEIALEISQKHMNEFALQCQKHVVDVVNIMMDNAEQQSKLQYDEMNRHDDLMKQKDSIINLLISKIFPDGRGVTAGPAATNVPMLSATASVVAPATVASSFSFGSGMLHVAAPGVSSTIAHSHGGCSSATKSLIAWGSTTGARTDAPATLSPPKKKNRTNTSIIKSSSNDATASAVLSVAAAAGPPGVPVPPFTLVPSSAKKRRRMDDRS